MRMRSNLDGKVGPTMHTMASSVLFVFVLFCFLFNVIEPHFRRANGISGLCYSCHIGIGSLDIFNEPILK